jgi:hypothetical protein
VLLPKRPDRSTIEKGRIISLLEAIVAFDLLLAIRTTFQLNHGNVSGVSWGTHQFTSET